ncbi:MAG: quinonprotein alcohol dehydrogenase, partial [Verrucomicrobiales bacterium]|nr:quinonprotein alcohol dehydrogenase [Verrucomicrobiales bacterium]
MPYSRALLSILLATTTFAHADWPTFRGPNGDGSVPPNKDGSPRTLPTEWSEDKNIAWKTEVAGRAWSTPAVGGKKIWLTNATEDGTRMSVVCLDLETGKKLHDQVLFENAKPEPLGNPVNGYGSPSPAVEPGRAYIHFGSYGTACLDTDNYKVIWQRRDLPCRHYRGPGSSPVLWKDTLILTMD